MTLYQTGCDRCFDLSGGPPLTIAWHTLWRHGWRRFARVVFEMNARSDPGKFIVSVMTVGAALAFLMYALIGSAVESVSQLFTH